MQRAHDVLVVHQQTSTSGCHCGEFGNKPEDLGRSYAMHVVQELSAAGLLIVDAPATDSIVIPVPLMAPFLLPLGAGAVQEVWDAFVRPDQDARMPQSIEMRALMAILRAVYQGMTNSELKGSGAGSGQA
jgi:hypothetical protein